MKPKTRGGEQQMQLLTEEIKQQLPALYTQENEADPTVYVKFFDPTGSWTWYATEGSYVDANGYYDTNEEKVDFLFFGLVIGFESELGYFSLNELENCKKGLQGIAAMPIERDLYFTPCKLSDAKKQHAIEHGWNK